MALNRLFASLTISPNLITRRFIHVAAVNFASKPNIDKPKPGLGKSYRRIVHFPDEYTVKPLEVTNLAGRDPVSGKLHITFYKMQFFWKIPTIFIDYVAPAVLLL